MTIPPSEPPENERFRQVSQVLQALECRRDCADNNTVS